MANYKGFTRTNYFSVNDAEKFRQIIADSYCSEGDIEVFEDDTCESIKFCFGCYGMISGIRTLPDGSDDDVSEYDAFVDALQSVLADGDAIIITEVGYEKLRYLIGHSYIITKSDVQFVSLRDKAIEEARNMLNNPEYDTKMEY